ncbi:hypothetical protein [Streptomyces sp. NPDC001770]
MPGQAKRKRRLEAERRRTAARTAPEAGRWDLVLETSDRAELRSHLCRLREAGVDEALIRIDHLCGRLEQESFYRLSRFVDR